MGQPGEITHECPTVKCYRNTHLSEVTSVVAGLLGGGPKMMIVVVESFAFGVASVISGTCAVHKVMRLVLCSDFAQSSVARCRHSHSASCVTLMFALKEPSLSI